MKSHIFETIVGAFVILIASWFIISVVSKSDEFYKINNTNNYLASFYDVSGITVGSNVKLGGVSIGKVINLDLNTINYNADMVLAIDKKVKIPDDSEIIITSEGLLGPKYVSITPGGSDTFLKQNDNFLYTQGSLSLNNLLQKFIGR